MEHVRYFSMETSIELAEAHGAFPAITESIYDPENITWEAPQPPHALQPQLAAPLRP